VIFRRFALLAAVIVGLVALSQCEPAADVRFIHKPHMA